MKAKANKRSCSIVVPCIELSILGQNKRPLIDETLHIEKKMIYFGPNWKLPFDSDDDIEFQINNILQALHDDEGGVDEGEDLELTFKSRKEAKKFLCIFRPQHRGERQQLLTFLNKFYNIYTKWADGKDSNSASKKSNHNHGSNLNRSVGVSRHNNHMDAFGRIHKNPNSTTTTTTAAYGSSSRSRLSPCRSPQGTSKNLNNVFHKLSANGNSGKSSSGRQGYGSKSATALILNKKRGRSSQSKYFQNKKNELLERDLEILESGDDDGDGDQLGYEEDDEEIGQGARSRHGNHDACVMEEDYHELLDEGDNNNDDLHMNKNASRSKHQINLSFRSNRRLKKARTVMVDENDSDEEFEKIAPMTKRVLHVDDGDDEGEENFGGNSHNDSKSRFKNRGKCCDRSVTEEHTQILKRTAVVSPVHDGTATANKTEKSDNLSDAVTDGEDEVNDEVIEVDESSTAAAAKETHTNIAIFFQPRHQATSNQTNKGNGNNVKLQRDENFRQGSCSVDIDLASEFPNHQKHSKKSPPRQKQVSKVDAMLGLSKSPNQESSQKSPSRQSKAPPQKSKATVINPYKNENVSVNDKCCHIGLKNLGNTCYLNSSLQMIFSIPGFMLALKKLYDNTTKKKSQTEGTPEENVMPLTRALLEVAWNAHIIDTYRSTNTEVKTAVSPKDVKTAMDKLTDKFAGYEQRDAHEFLSDLIDLLHDELLEVTENEKDTLPTDEFFRLDVKVCLTCNSCNYTRCKEELYRHLSIEVRETEFWTVNQGLEQFFKPEVRELKCEKCESGTTATQTIEVLSRPKALLLHLKRFIVDTSGRTMTLKKNKARIVYAQSISLDQLQHHNDATKDEPSYKLRGLVRHIGNTAFSGHYTANCQRRKPGSVEATKTEEWVSFDDGTASVTSLPSILENEKNQRTNYMMLYA